jgi:hypothetical protein
MRQVVERRIARLVQLSIRQARYVGQTKTLFQVCLAAAVANLTLLVANSDAFLGNWFGLVADASGATADRVACFRPLGSLFSSFGPPLTAATLPIQSFRSSGL